MRVCAGHRASQRGGQARVQREQGARRLAEAALRNDLEGGITLLREEPQLEFLLAEDQLDGDVPRPGRGREIADAEIVVPFDVDLAEIGRAALLEDRPERARLDVDAVVARSRPAGDCGVEAAPLRMVVAHPE